MITGLTPLQELVVELNKGTCEAKNLPKEIMLCSSCRKWFLGYGSEICIQCGGPKKTRVKAK